MSPPPIRDYSVDIAKTCARIHAAFTGSGDPIFEDELKKCASQLVTRLSRWHSSKHGERYDNAMKELLTAALEEANIMINQASWVAIRVKRKDVK